LFTPSINGVHPVQCGLMLEILPQLLVNSLITGSIYALAGAGLALTFTLLRTLNFAHGHIMMAGAYAFFFFHVQEGFSVLSAAFYAAVVLSIMATIILFVFLAPFLRAQSLLPLVTTIALGSMLEALASLQFGVSVRSLPVVSNGESIEWQGLFFTRVQILIIASAITILSFMAYVIHKTSLGRLLRSIAENPRAAESLGISRTGMTLGGVIVSTLLAGYAGILIGYETNIQPTMGNIYSIKAFAAMVLGGLGNIWGTIVGALILGLVENLSIGLDFGGYSLPAGYKDAFAFIVILVVLLFRPQGLFGNRRRFA
jgi:branched-chain amino acid transport system permease protein